MVHNTSKRTPPHRQTLNRNKHTRQTHHQQQPVGREDRRNHRSLRHRHQRCVTPKSQPAAGSDSPCSPLSTSTMGLSPSSCTYTIVDPSEPVRQQTLSFQHHEQPLILASLRGGLASSTASLLCQGLRYLRPN
jgi:hypothetical protein